MSKNILLVEDSKEIFRMVQHAIADPTVAIHWAESIEAAHSQLNSNKFDLILLDIELPDGNGINLCTEIQSKNSGPPIFFLTSHTTLSEKVLGFSAGADDYITKPFNTLELKARIEAKLKKQEILKQSSDVLKWKELEINKSRQEVRIVVNGQPSPVDLTALEFKILTYFADRPGEVIDRDTMLDQIWGKDVHVYSRSVDTHVSKLRKKLGPIANVIESVHGAGYKFIPAEL